MSGLPVGEPAATQVSPCLRATELCRLENTRPSESIKQHPGSHCETLKGGWGEYAQSKPVIGEGARTEAPVSS